MLLNAAKSSGLIFARLVAHKPRRTREEFHANCMSNHVAVDLPVSWFNSSLPMFRLLKHGTFMLYIQSYFQLKVTTIRGPQSDEYRDSNFKISKS